MLRVFFFFFGEIRVLVWFHAYFYLAKLASRSNIFNSRCVPWAHLALLYIKLVAWLTNQNYFTLRNIFMNRISNSWIELRDPYVLTSCHRLGFYDHVLSLHISYFNARLFWDLEATTLHFGLWNLQYIQTSLDIEKKKGNYWSEHLLQAKQGDQITWSSAQN